jgi:glyoxylase-like metal-dependent hydrolase (beta-lactamase superfamily II)
MSRPSEIAPGIHHFPTGPFNWYLIEQAGRLTLVDAGFPGHYPFFASGLRQIGRTHKDLAAIVITHAHADHTGFAERVRQETGAPVFIHKDDLAQSARILQLPWVGLLSNAWRPYTGGMLAHATWNGVFTCPSIARAQPVQDGDQLDIPGRPILFHTPGHTPGESVLYLPDRNVLFSGDTLVTRNLFTGAEGPPQLPGRQLNHDDKQARRSLHRLRELGKLTLLPGHGRPWHGEMDAAVNLS